MASPIIRRSIQTLTQSINTPYVPDKSLPVIVEEELKLRLHNVPSPWGVMVSDKLLSLELPDDIRPNFSGLSFYFDVPIKATYEVLGYRPGDVLTNMRLKAPISQQSIYKTRRAVEILGLPFSIEVKNAPPVSSVNIMIQKHTIRTALCYIASPVYYPHYTTLVASRASPEEEDTWYDGMDTTGWNRKLTTLELCLLDPFAEFPLKRMKALQFDIAHTLGLPASRLNFSGGELIGKRTGKKGSIKPNPGGDVSVVIKRIEDVLPTEDAIFTPVLPLPISYTGEVEKEYPTLVCAISPSVTGSPEQLRAFRNGVKKYLTIKRMEICSFRSLFPEKVLSAPLTSPIFTEAIPELQLVSAYMSKAGEIRRLFEPSSASTSASVSTTGKS